ncbi:hypothetical protein IJQ51_03110 [Candidatus Saccharibacteria bacterium]|nr:hypothetical protein [Candidatus Saccharibacteria bacterium]
MRNKKIILSSSQPVDYDNTSDKTIGISVSKAENIYHDFVEAPKLSTALSPFGYSVTFFIAASTCDPDRTQNIFGINLNLSTIFWIATFLSIAIGFMMLAKWFSVGRGKNKEAFISAMKKYGEGS